MKLSNDHKLRKHPIQFRLTDEQFARLKANAERNGDNPNATARLLMLDALLAAESYHASAG